jgi:hypothetical protein
MKRIQVSIVRIFGLTCVLSALLSSESFAQDRKLEITGFIGGLSISHDLGSATNVYFTATGAAENASFGKFFGARAGYFFSPFIGVEGYLTRGKNSFTYAAVDDREVGTADLGEQFDATQLSYGGSAILQYPLENGVVPYGTVGFGWQRSNPQNPISGIDDSISSTDFNLGGGVKYFFEGQNLPWLGVRFELRYHLISDGLAFFESEASPRNTEFTFGGVVRPF